MAVKVRGSAGTYQGAGFSTVVVSVPAGIVDGDLMILFAECATAQTITTPSGWQVIGAGDATNRRLQAYSRIASSEPGSYTITFSAVTAVSTGVILALYDDAAHPLSIDTSAYSGPVSASTATPATVTPSQNYCAIIQWLDTASSGDILTPDNWTSVGQKTNHDASVNNAAIGMLPLGATTSYTNPTWTRVNGSNATWEAATIAIKGAVDVSSHAITERSYAHTGNAASASVVVVVPTGTANGDVMVASIQAPSTRTITPPAGWILLQTESGNTLSAAVYWRVASSEPADYTWTFSASGGNNGTIVTFQQSGLPLVVDASAKSVSAGSASFASPTVTTTQNDDLIFTSAFSDGSTVNSGPDGQLIALEIANRTQFVGYQTGPGVSSALTITSQSARRFIVTVALAVPSPANLRETQTTIDAIVQGPASLRATQVAADVAMQTDPVLRVTQDVTDALVRMEEQYRVTQLTMDVLIREIPIPPIPPIPPTPPKPSEGGDLIALTFNQEQTIVGWHRHPLGGGARVESIAVIPSPDGANDELWMIVARTIDGRQHRYIEYLTPSFDIGDLLEDAFFVDCGLTYTGAPASRILGLDHLEGCTVDVLADGATHPQRTVTNGTITLARAASKVQIGFPCPARLVKMRMEAGAANGTAQSKIKRIHKLNIRLLNSLGGQYGEFGGQLDRLMYRKPTDAMDTAVPLFTGDITNLTWPDGYTRDGRVEFYIDEPLPVTLVAFYPSEDTQDGG